MSIGRRLPVDRAAKLEVADDRTWPQIEVFVDQFFDLFIADLARAEGLDVDTQWLGHADGVGELDFAAVGEAGGDDVFGNPSGCVGTAAVDFGAVFAAEGAATVPAHAAVGVDDNFATGQAGVAHRAADDKATCRVLQR